MAAFPIEHWSYSSLMAFLRNPLAWYKRYVEKVYDTPASASSFIGRAGHVALEHFFKGVSKDDAIARGLEYLRNVQDAEINFGKLSRPRERRRRRAEMEREYLRAVSFYLARPPRYDILGVEVRAVASVPGLPLPVKAVSDLVVRSRGSRRAVDIIDHKFVDAFSPLGPRKTLFILQAIFNYYTIRDVFGAPVRRFIVRECKKSRNADGSPQLRRYAIDFRDCREEFALFRRLLADATEEIVRRRIYLPNPSDVFEGENSFDIYRLGLAERGKD